ncbi:MAG: HAD family hydrolase [Cyanobacteria bacterium P01_F01_bin.42]
MVMLQVNDQMFPNIEAIIFDKDGTLANTEAYLVQLGLKRSRLVDAQVPGVQEPLQMAFGLEQDRVNPAGILAVASRRDTEAVTAGFIAETGRPWIESLNLAQSAFTEAADYLSPQCEYTPLVDGVSAMLNSLSQASLKLAILSSDTTENVGEFIDHHRLNEQIHTGWGEQKTFKKPDPQLLVSLCAQLQVEPERTVMVGDSDADIQMAIAAGITAIGVTWGWQTPIQLPQATVEISHPSQLQVVTP